MEEVMDALNNRDWEIDGLVQPGQAGQAARPAQTASVLSPWASETIGRS